jgi:mannose-6-phosphate isomerase
MPTKGTLPMPVKPIALAANQPPRFYLGGAGIAKFRGTPQPGPDRPEDFIASTTEVFGGGGGGLTVLDDGRRLRDVIEESPESFLGPDHVAEYGSDVGLLVKMLDTGQRLLVHFHPDVEFAARHLDCQHGKNEAWIILEVADVPDDESAGHVYFGFAADVEAQVVADWVSQQDTTAILRAMNKIVVMPGDVFFVPAGIPHAIGTGITLVELQEPTDFSILLEWKGYRIDGPAEGHLDLGFDVALQALDRRGWTAQQISEVRAGSPWELDQRSPAGPVAEVLPGPARTFFRAQAVTVGNTPVSFPPEFAVLVVLAGEGTLNTAAGSMELQRGATVLVPFAAGPSELTGELTLLRCLTPTPSVADRTA